ncbi:hypothetical protein OHB11_34880 [Streptomyces zaomyceticus]|uniref:hypothetical protein n=1 Tax=Streptomyces zaomyceticus TaxID=68286 RepID=UPI002E0F9715|nr:hypothetical protein OG237_04990 [Streptomyces zaomyceticus]
MSVAPAGIVPAARGAGVAAVEGAGVGAVAGRATRTDVVAAEAAPGAFPGTPPPSAGEVAGPAEA